MSHKISGDYCSGTYDFYSFLDIFRQQRPVDDDDDDDYDGDDDDDGNDAPAPAAAPARDDVQSQEIPRVIAEPVERIQEENDVNVIEEYLNSEVD